MIQSASPYLSFPGNTLEAFEHYRRVFGVEFLAVMRFREFPGGMGVTGDDLDRICHIALPLGSNGQMLMGTDVLGPHRERFVVGTNTYIHLDATDADEARRLFDGLGEGGAIEMPLSKVEWAELYGIVRDRFGVQWMVSHTGDVRFVPPGG